MMTHTEKDFDVIIIGAGHNGLTAAAILALKGKRVCVLEKSSAIGGMSQNYAVHDNIITSRIAHLAYNLNPVVLKELGLTERIELQAIPTIALSPNGRHIEIDNGRAKFADGAQHPDASAYAAIYDKIQMFAKLLAPVALQSPPDMSGEINLASIREMRGFAKLGLDLKRLGKKDMREFLRIVLSNVYDFVLDEMPDGPLAGNLAADAVWGAWSGPRSPGTVFSLLYRNGTGTGAATPVGGMGSVVNAIADVAREKGTDIRTNACVQRLIIDSDCVQGVVLEDGEQITANGVMSSAAAYQSMIMAGVEHFDVEAVRRLRNVRTKGTTAKVNLVLRDIPEVPGLTKEQLAGRLVVAPSAFYVERAFNAVKYNIMAKAPVIEAIIPSLSDPTRSAGSRHVLSAIVQYIPYHLNDSWTDATRRQLTELTLKTLSEFMPSLRDLIVHVDTLSPADIERETGVPGGHWHHGELSTDQLFSVRPVNGMSRYAFGVRGFYLCGAAAHPGGDISGAAGRNSALQLMKDGVLG